LFVARMDSSAHRQSRPSVIPRLCLSHGPAVPCVALDPSTSTPHHNALIQAVATRASSIGFGTLFLAVSYACSERPSLHRRRTMQTSLP
jgi:hypothetical protein